MFTATRLLNDPSSAERHDLHCSIEVGELIQVKQSATEFSQVACFEQPLAGGDFLTRWLSLEGKSEGKGDIRGVLDRPRMTHDYTTRARKKYVDDVANEKRSEKT